MAASTVVRMGRKRQPQDPDIAKELSGRFGVRLRKLAESRDFTAATLAAEIGKTPQVVRLYYAGKVVPALNDWPVIAKALGVKLRELLPQR